MKIYRLFAIVSLLLTLGMPLASRSIAAPMTLKCPSCGMPMTTTKGGMMTVPLVVDGKKWYCCPMCPSGKKAAEYTKTHHGKLLMVSTKPKM